MEAQSYSISTEVEGGTNAILLNRASRSFLLNGLFKLHKCDFTCPTTNITVAPMNCGIIVMFLTHIY